MFRQWSLGWAWNSSETQLTRQIFLPWNRWWYRCHDDAVMMISWYHNMALAWSGDEGNSLPRSKDRNRGTSSNTTSVTMCLIQVTVSVITYILFMILYKISWNSKWNLWKRKNSPEIGVKFLPVAIKFSKGSKNIRQVSVKFGIVFIKIKVDLMGILITVDIFLPKVGLSDWARFDEKGNESVEPIFPYRWHSVNCSKGEKHWKHFWLF